MGRNAFFRSVLVGTVASVTLLPAAAWGQAASEGASRPEGTGIEDIVVTARRRAESLQTVPVAASAFNEQTLVRRSITDIRAFAQSVPSLSISQSGSSGSASIINIRGQEGSNIAMAFDPAVGVYVDEVYMARSLGSQLSNLSDVEGVEVLRGVQGTLFGRNNTGGAIIIRPNKPELDREAASGLISYGSHNRLMVQGMVNIPIIQDKLAVRVSGNWLLRDGFQRAPNSGLYDYGERNRGALRVSVRAQPTETLTLDLAYDRSMMEERGQLVSNYNTPDYYNNSQAGFRSPISRGVSDGFTGKILQDFGSTQVKAIVAYRRIHFLDQSDVDGTPSPSIDVYQFKREHQFTAELNANSSLYKGDGFLTSLDLTAGVFYFEEEGTEPRRTPITSTTSVGVIQNGDARNLSKAAYAQFEAKLMEKLAIFVGGRYTKDNRRYTSQVLSNGNCATIPGATLANCFRAGSADFGYWSYTAGARYNFTPTAQIYAKISRGNRSGGLDNNTALPFKPEVNNELEAGFKVDWFDHRLRTNLAAFRNKFDNIQRSSIQTVNGIPTATVSNAARASIKGIEFEGTVVPVDGLTLSGSLGYVDAAYQSYIVPLAAGGFLDLTNAKFQNVPKWTYSVSGEYVKEFSAGEISARADWGWRSSVFLEATNDPALVQKSYGILNARIAFSPSTSLLGTHTTFAVFATNLLDKRYIAGATRLAAGFYALYPTSEPRIIGGEVSFKF